MKKRLLTAVLFLSSILVALLIGEVAVYVLYREKIALFPRYISDVRYGDYRIRRNIPGAQYTHKSYDGEWEFRINSQGFRDDREFSYDKSEGVLRVLVLGDSFTIGYEVQQDETFSAVLESTLRGNGIAAEVINAGMSGNSTAEELIFFEQEGRKYEPDVVILAFYRNDLGDNVRTNLFGLEKGELVERSRIYLPAIGVRNFLNSSGIYRWLSENSYLHNYLSNVATLAVKRWVLVKRGGDQAPSTDPSGTLGSKEMLAARLLERLYRATRNSGASLIVLDIPFQKHEQMHPSLPPEFLSDQFKFFDAYVSGVQILKAYVREGPLYRPHGHHHWTGLSHAVAGRALGQAVLALEGLAR